MLSLVVLPLSILLLLLFVASKAMMHEPMKPIMEPMTSNFETSLNRRIEEDEEEGGEEEEPRGTVYSSVNSSSSSSLPSRSSS